jgi:hypothetical protein
VRIYRLDGDAAAVTRLSGRAGLGQPKREPPCDPGTAEKMTAEVFGHDRASKRWRRQPGPARPAAEASAADSASGSRRRSWPRACSASRILF